MNTNIIDQGLSKEAYALMPELDKRYKKFFSLASKANKGEEFSDVQLALAQADVRSLLAIMSGEHITYADEARLN